MKTTLSTESREKIFHLPGCPYSGRIRYKNRMFIGMTGAEELGYRPCRYCCTMRGFYNINRWRLEIEAKKNGFRFAFAGRTDTLYIRTDNGAWKIFVTPDVRYRLFHLNGFDPSMTKEQVMNGKYHRHTDVKISSAPFSLIDYIVKHDKAKKTIEEDYRKLPQKTKKEKRYYRYAQKRHALKSKRRVSELLDCIACGEIPESKWVSYTT